MTKGEGSERVLLHDSIINGFNSSNLLDDSKMIYSKLLIRRYFKKKLQNKLKQYKYIWKKKNRKEKKMRRYKTEIKKMEDANISICKEN